MYRNESLFPFVTPLRVNGRTDLIIFFLSGEDSYRRKNIKNCGTLENLKILI